MALSRLWPRRWTRLLIIVSALCLLVGVFAASAQDGGTLRVAINAPVTLDPALHANDTETAFNRAIYDYLIEVKSDGSLAPNLATGWEISDDNLTYTFTLAEGVTFHNGAPFTSADVVWTFNRLKTAASPALGLLGEFEVSAPDAQTVVFTVPSVNADFLYGVGSRWALIIPDGEDTPNALAEGDNPYENFNGTGPFVLQSFSPEDHTEFTANANYWIEGQPLLSGLTFIYIGDTVAQVDALLSDSVDFIFRVPNTQLDRLESAEGLQVFQVPTAQHAVIRLRTDQGPGTDPLVRQAFKVATDRDQLNDVLLGGRGIIGNNDPIGPVYSQYYDADLAKPAYDPASACQLLADAGYADGLEMSLFVPNAFEYPDMAALLQQQWAAGCITVTIEVREENIYYSDGPDNWLAVDLGITGWGARPIPQQYLQEAYETGALYNESHWSDPDLDALIAQARETTDEAARADIYAQISAIFAERGPIIVPYFAPMLGAANARVQGIDMNPYPGSTDYRTVSIQES